MREHAFNGDGEITVRRLPQLSKNPASVGALVSQLDILYCQHTVVVREYRARRHSSVQPRPRVQQCLTSIKTEKVGITIIWINIYKM